MRRPTCSATRILKSQPDQKPKSSQRLEPQGFTLKGMPVRLSSQRTRQTQGIALVIVLLSAMILMVSLLAISATMTISSQRTTVDQSVTLPAQYAAEAGVARATANLAEIDGVMRQINVTNSTRTQIEGHIRSYCNGGTVNFSPTPPNNEICRVGSGNLSNRYSIFSTYIPSSAYPAGTTSSTYWTNVFGVSSASAKISTDAVNKSETWYNVNYKNAAGAPAGPLKPTRVLLAGRNSYQFEFAVSPTRSDGEIRAGGKVVATRSIEKQTEGSISLLNVNLPTFARNFVFRDVTESLEGDQLYFAGGESFGGPVHTNGTPGFYKKDGVTPVFTDDFSSCARGGSFSGYSDQTDVQNTFQGSSPQFGVDPCISLPRNSNNQKRASFGGDASNTDPVADQELFDRFRPAYINSNDPNAYNGVYYSQGDYRERNKANSWLGGMYIRGDVDQLKLSTTNGRQVISLKQGSTTTTFTENTDGTWTVVPPSTGKRLTGTFNGMIYVEGDINDMRGDGSTTADLAPKSKLMVTSTGRVLLKDDITYVDMPDPDRPESEVNAALATVKDNVLGIYSSGEKCEPVNRSTSGCGSILADGADGKDLNIHASLMATKEISRTANRRGEGFGAVRNDKNIGQVTQRDADNKKVKRKAQIKLFGGVIEKQSQTVGDTKDKGYARNYKYDKRFKSGFAPPFFPEQAEGGESAVIAKWEADLDSATPIGGGQSLWQTVSKPVSN